MRVIFVGNDWAEDHHDVHVMNAEGKRLRTKRLPEGLAGIAGMHELLAGLVEDPEQVVIGIETDRGLWGRRPACRWISGVRDQPVGGGSLPRPPRCWRWRSRYVKGLATPVQRQRDRVAPREGEAGGDRARTLPDGAGRAQDDTSRRVWRLGLVCHPAVARVGVK